MKIDEFTGEIVGPTITDTLELIGGGTYLDTATQRLAGLVAAVNTTGKPGKIGLILTIKRATNGGAMHITGAVKVTPPVDEPIGVTLFATGNGDLVTDDPAQNRLDLERTRT